MKEGRDHEPSRGWHEIQHLQPVLWTCLPLATLQQWCALKLWENGLTNLSGPLGPQLQNESNYEYYSQAPGNSGNCALGMLVLLLFFVTHTFPEESFAGCCDSVPPPAWGPADTGWTSQDFSGFVKGPPLRSPQVSWWTSIPLEGREHRSITEDMSPFPPQSGPCSLQPGAAVPGSFPPSPTSFSWGSGTESKACNPLLTVSGSCVF